MAQVTFLKYLSDDIQRDMVRALEKLGQEAMNHAYVNSRFTNRTGNLHDSYGMGVYVNGALVQSSVRYLGDGVLSHKANPKTKKTGRRTIQDYLHNMSWGKQNQEVVLIVAAAMYYAGILEGKGEYKVISPAREYINSRIDGVTQAVYAKHGIKLPVRTRVIKGERLRGESGRFI